MSQYVYEPCLVAKTLLARLGRRDKRLSVFPSTREWSEWGAEQIVATGGSVKDSLFLLASRNEESDYRLVAAWGEHHEFSVDVLDRVEADPLWESAEGICAHMDCDHSDTYPRFLNFCASIRHGSLNMIGSEEGPETPLTMEWVERSGFFLCTGPERGRRSYWIPFPKPCDTPNEVRKTLIQMLRGTPA